MSTGCAISGMKMGMHTVSVLNSEMHRMWFSVSAMSGLFILMFVYCRREKCNDLSKF